MRVHAASAFVVAASLALRGAATAIPATPPANPYLTAPVPPATPPPPPPPPGGLTVDLGYEVYKGVEDTTNGLRVWKGIRYAAAPIGALRWQKPRVPVRNRAQVINADTFGPQCPQTSFGSPAPGNAYGNEDCLFLNVYAPKNANNLPVLVWIHGGGYGLGDGRQDMTQIINANAKGFVAVVIQYRLGAFGFLSSNDVFNKGVVNAGLLDQYLSLQWVQAFIRKFGGDPTSVTISGLSAGGGSVMLLNMAYGGTVGPTLFTNSFASSPYLPTQHGYKDSTTTGIYNSFVSQAGCSPTPSTYASTFDCLVAQDTIRLQNASFAVSGGGLFGTWAFTPVTDGTLIQDLPSVQLQKKKVNGRRMLTGNNAQEGGLFLLPTIQTEADVIAWMKQLLPYFTNAQIADVLSHYPVQPITGKYATNGISPPNANYMSETASGQQQRAYNIYAETTFVCPSYWLAEAFSGLGRVSYKYQYSVVPAFHSTDSGAYFGPPFPFQSADFNLAFAQIVGNFVIRNDPSISAAVANGASSANPAAPNPATSWPVYSVANPQFINLNQTGGTPTAMNFFGFDLVIPMDPGLRNDLTVANAFTWEGNRGARCNYWRSIGLTVPE